MKPFEQWRTGPGELSCRTVGKTIQAYLDNESDPALRDRMAEHLDDCAKCGLDAEVLRRIKRSLEGGRQDLDPRSVDRLRQFVEDLDHPG